MINLTVSDMLGEIYCLRNHTAHGDKVPDVYYQTTGRATFDGNITKFETLMESISFIIRRCLLKILSAGLLDEFANESTSRLYFSQLGLTKTEIKSRPGGQAVLECPKD
jgi:hypothetical protein